MSAAQTHREAAPAAAPEPVTLTARDGRRLAALYLEAPAPRGALVVNGATGFPREFYLKFASYCAGRGYHAMVYDYRGMGASATLPLGREPARMSEWGLLDMPAALEWLEKRCRGKRLKQGSSFHGRDSSRGLGGCACVRRQERDFSASAGNGTVSNEGDYRPIVPEPAEEESGGSVQRTSILKASALGPAPA